MALNIPAERDLSLIFERDDVIDACAGHCASSHYDADAYASCPSCQQLRATLGNAIVEWLGLVDQDRATAPAALDREALTSTARDLLLKYGVRLAVELCTTDAAWYRCQECALSWKGTRDAHPEDTECDVYLALAGLRPAPAREETGR